MQFQNINPTLNYRYMTCNDWFTPLINTPAAAVPSAANIDNDTALARKSYNTTSLQYIGFFNSLLIGLEEGWSYWKSGLQEKERHSRETSFFARVIYGSPLTLDGDSY